MIYYGYVRSSRSARSRKQNIFFQVISYKLSTYKNSSFKEKARVDSTRFRPFYHRAQYVLSAYGVLVGSHYTLKSEIARLYRPHRTALRVFLCPDSH